MPKKLPFVLVFILFSLLLAIRYTLSPDTTDAAISSCSVSVGPDFQNAGSSGTLSFGVTNNDEFGNSILWIKITAPSSNFVITDGTGLYVTAVNINGSGSEIIISLSGLSPGEYGEYYISVTTSENVMPAMPFGVQVSDTVSGDNPVSCSGNTGVSITSPGQEIINISNLLVSFTDTTASISWNTAVNTTGQVDYGTSNQYGSTIIDSNMSTSHTISLTGLSANTVYHFRVTSINADNDIAQLTDNIFTTALAGVKTTTTITVTATTATPTPAPKPLVDTIAPTVFLETDFSKPFKEAPKITGKASDSGATNVGIRKVEYSIDSGRNWLPVDNLKNLGAKSTTFEFTPFILDDGNYEIVVRAEDSSGNRGLSKKYILVIDRLPPLIGGNLLSLGPLVLMPDSNGVMITMAGIEQKITLSAVGGPISLDLLVNEKSFSLDYSPETGLWSGMISLIEPGLYRLKTKAIDGANNKTERELNPVAVVASGRVVDGETDEKVTQGKISLFVQDPQSDIWALWDAKTFGQENPQSLNEEGGYQLFLPPGTYYLQIKSPGFATLTSRIFTLTQSAPFNAVFRLKPGRKIKLGLLSFGLPDFLTDFLAEKATVKLEKPSLPEDLGESELLNQEAFNFSLPTSQAEEFELRSLRGKASVLSFISTWSPPALEQILVLDKLVQEKVISVVAVVTQEAVSRVSIFQKRGDYQVPMVVDRDGDLVEEYNLNSLPTHYFLDRKGIVRKVITGVLDENQIVEAMEL